MVSSNTTIDPTEDHYSDIHHHYHSTHSPSHLLFTTREPLCYFTYIPSAPSDHWSTETPLPSPDLRANIVADPANPLLAARIPLLSPASAQSMSAEKLLQLQTAAAHPQRPRPQPRQDVLDLSDDSSSSSSMSSRSSSVGSACSNSSSSSSSSRPKICSRCQTNYGEFVAFSLNGYYCTRCAKITGYGG